MIFPTDLFYLESSPIVFGLVFGLILVDILFDIIHWIKEINE